MNWEGKTTTSKFKYYKVAQFSFRFFYFYKFEFASSFITLLFYSPTESLCLSLVSTSATWWKDFSVTSKKANELFLGTNLLTTSFGSPLASRSNRSSVPPSFSLQSLKGWLISGGILISVRSSIRFIV